MAAPLSRTKQQKFSYADYCKWPDDQRCELIDGTVYMMNAPMRVHQKISGELLFQLLSYFKGKPCEVYAAPFDVRLAHASKNDNEIFTVVQPDLSIICDHSKLDDKGCIGAPDMVIEILSQSSLSYDNVRKRALYEKVGVKEFWLVHPTDMLVTVYTLINGAYSKPDIYDHTSKVAPVLFPELMINLGEVFGIEPDANKAKESPAPYKSAAKTAPNKKPARKTATQPKR